MNLIKEWTFCICSTVIVSVIFSLLAPKGSSGRFYKSVISLFIFISFLFPFTQIGDKKLDFNLDNINIEAENNTNSIAEGVVKTKLLLFWKIIPFTRQGLIVPRALMTIMRLCLTALPFLLQMSTTVIP